jgi:hypothetical protein
MRSLHDLLLRAIRRHAGRLGIHLIESRGVMQPITGKEAFFAPHV